MKLRFWSALSLTALTLAPPILAQTTLSIDCAKTGARLSPYLHGIFFEEINHAGDGGLYAEKLRDRAFSEGAAHWKPLATGGAKMEGGTLFLEAGGGVETEGYWGIGAQRGKRLRFSAQGVQGEARLVLLTPSGVVIATATLKSGEKSVLLSPNADCPKARLQIVALGARAQLSAPSLMPLDTYKKTPLRKDLATLIAEMKPSFVRFPGGCFVEGDYLANRFQWKLSLGDPSKRAGNQCIWGYKATNGLGFHEYLVWAESMGAEPLFVINCGMSHNDLTPLEGMDAVVQDALDAIEYANGDAKTTKWGAERAKNGHPKPFGLKLIEIGNENGGPEYDKRYAMLYQAIRKRDPKIHLIANVWGGTPKSAAVDIVDEHYYSSPGFFQRQATRYDRYPAESPKVYVGEYAVTEGCGKGNLIAALGEATFITGMERNSDKVIMASYAPLLVNANDRKWNPDAIVFDSFRAYGTPSYWVQRMFSQNRGDVVLPLRLQEEARPTQASGAARGKVGVGTWRTSAEFADVRVNGQPVEISPSAGHWEKGDKGFWRQTDLEENRRAIGGASFESNYTLTLRARKREGAEGFLILFHVRDADNYFWWNLGGWQNTIHNIEMATNGGKERLVPDVQGRIETGRWYDIKIVCEGRHIRCYLDSRLIHDAQVPPPPSNLAAVSTRDEKTGDILIKVVNMGDQAQEATLDLQNAPPLKPEGKAITLTSGRPEDENSFEAPLRVSPQTKTISGVAAQMRYRFPAYSATILRLKTR